MKRLAWCLLLVAASAHANPAAEKLFQDGRSLLAAGKLPEACDAFRRSQEIEPRVGTLLNLADCEEKRGRIATAWEVFVQARALAAESNDRRGGEAGKRAGVLAAKLPYLTVHAPATRPEGFTVTREGTALLAAELDHEVPIDPGTYTFVASAPGHVAWTQPITVGIGQHASLDIPALVADPAANPDVTTTTTTITPPATPAIDAVAAPRITAHHLGLGAAVGFSTDGDLIVGARIPLQLAEVGRGAVRVLPSLFYARIKPDPNDDSHVLDLYALGLGIEYVAPLAPRFFVAAGAGVGVDLLDDNFEDSIAKTGWGAVRLSPTLRLGPAVDVGFHIQVVKTSENVVGLGELGVDYFFW